MKHLFAILSTLVLASCASAMPSYDTCTTPSGVVLYCAVWESNLPIAGEVQGRLCAGSKLQLESLKRALQSVEPKATIQFKDQTK